MTRIQQPDRTVAACTHCGLVKPVHAFTSDCHQAAGRRSECRLCRSAVRRYRLAARRAAELTLET